MARPLFDIQHFVGCLQGSAIPPIRPYNRYTLMGVGPMFWVPVGTRFPAVIPRYDLFARFYVRRPGRCDFEVEVRHSPSRGRWTEVDVYGPFAITFRPGEPVRDHTFRLLNVPAPNYGRFRFRLRPLGYKKVRADEYLELMDTP